MSEWEYSPKEQVVHALWDILKELKRIADALERGKNE